MLQNLKIKLKDGSQRIVLAGSAKHLYQDLAFFDFTILVFILYFITSFYIYIYMYIYIYIYYNLKGKEDSFIRL